MRIAQIAPIAERVPPKKYGGTERVVHALTEELVARGHEVVLFASGDSKTSATLRSVYPRSLREAKISRPYDLNYLTLSNIGLAYGMQEEFDIIHDHHAPLSLPLANLATTPTLVTMHGAFNSETKRMFDLFPQPAVATISQSQYGSSRITNHAGTVYNGLDMEHYPFGATPGQYALFVGRISMEKGVHHAIEAAQHLDLPLIIAAKLDPGDAPYFHEYVEPYLSDRIRWIGEVDEKKRNLLMSRARCLLHPVTWREPFGLVLIEAMACGCPVIGFNKGAIPEVVRHGLTGYVVEDVEELCAAILNIEKIDRATCRSYALERFSAKRMADEYVHLYEQLIKRARRPLWHPLTPLPSGGFRRAL